MQTGAWICCVSTCRRAGLTTAQIDIVEQARCWRLAIASVCVPRPRILSCCKRTGTQLQPRSLLPFTAHRQTALFAHLEVRQAREVILLQLRRRCSCCASWCGCHGWLESPIQQACCRKAWTIPLRMQGVADVFLPLCPDNQMLNGSPTAQKLKIATPQLRFLRRRSPALYRCCATFSNSLHQVWV